MYSTVSVQNFPKLIRLMFAGARMEDGRNMTAEDYNVTDGSVLYLLQASTF